MLVDHRTYTVPHEFTQEYLRRYEAVGLLLQRRHLGHHLGCFVNEMGSHDQVIHMWGFDSMADREVRRERMEQDPDWQAFRQWIAGTFSAQETKILRAVPLSGGQP